MSAVCSISKKAVKVADTSCLDRLDRPVLSIVSTVKYRICFIFSMLHKHFFRRFAFLKGPSPFIYAEWYQVVSLPTQKFADCHTSEFHGVELSDLQQNFITANELLQIMN